MLTVQPPQLNFNREGIPCSEYFGDPYFSLTNPLEESHFVFLDSTNILTRWQNRHFIIGEVGFGFGINFLTTAEAWIKKSPNHQLHFISIEKHPVRPNDLLQCYQRLEITTSLAKHLIENYPPPVQGSHRIHFKEYNISLTLLFGEALDCLSECDFQADAWYLDGFAPSKNPDLWNESIANEVFRLTKMNGTISTYSAASEVNKNFTQAGFTLSKKSGFGKKREMLTGTRKTKPKPSQFHLNQKSWLRHSYNPTLNKNALIIGAGMAGCMISAALASRGWHVTIIERNSSLASEASGNPNAILMPRLSVDHDVQSQLTLSGYLYTIRLLDQLQHRSNSFSWQQCGAIQVPRDEAQWQRMHTIASQEKIPTCLLEEISRSKASELAQCEIAHDAWHIPLAGWLQPTELCNAVIEQYPNQIELIYNSEVSSIKFDDDIWCAFDKNSNLIEKADALIIANAFSAKKFAQSEWCELFAKRGQITLVPEQECNEHPEKIICADGYITPSINNQILIGASFITGDMNTEIRQEEHESNIDKAKKILPSISIDLSNHLQGRAAIRAVSKDRLPIVGPVAKQEAFDHDFYQAALGSVRDTYPTPKYYQNLYIASGFGSRGLSWIPLCSEVLACIINNEPSPIDKHLQEAIHPGRLLMNNLVKRVQLS